MSGSAFQNQPFLTGLFTGTLTGKELFDGDRAGSILKFSANQIAYQSVAAGYAARAVHDTSMAGIQRWVSDFLGRNEWTQTAIVMNTGNPTYYLSTNDAFSCFRSSAATGYIHCDGLDYNVWTMFIPSTGTTTHLYVGQVAEAAGESWQGAGGATKLTLTGGNMYLIIRGQGTWWCIQMPAFTTTSAAAFPAFDEIDLIMGQSWAAILAQAAYWGIEAWKVARSLNRNIFIPGGTAFGSSSILEGGAAVGNNWRIQSTNSAGPRQTQAFAAITTALAANPGVLVKNVHWVIGANEFPVLTSMAQYNVLVTQITNLMLDLKAALAANNPNVNIFLTPLPNTDPIGAAVTKGAYYAVRRAFVEATDQANRIWRGGEFSAYSRPYGEIHHNNPVMSAFAKEMAQHQGRRTSGLTTVGLNPLIRGGVTRVSPGRFRIAIDRYGGLPSAGLSVTALNKPALPIGFAIYTSEDWFVANEANVIRPYAFSWEGLAGGYELLDLYTVGDTMTPSLAYPYDNFAEASTQKDQLIYVDDNTTGVRLYLGTYHPSK